MAYRLGTDAPVGTELKRIARKQLRLAVAALRKAGRGGFDPAVHAARRHIKKARAIGRLVDGTITPSFRDTNRRLRRVARQLGPVADSAAVIGTLHRLSSSSGPRLPRDTFVLVHKRLLRRKRRSIQRTKAARVLQRAAQALRGEEMEIGGWVFRARGFSAVAAGLGRTYRQGRRAMAEASAHPRTDTYHAWRRRAKDLWFQVRLLEGRCGTLAVDRERLEALDGYLGECHNCAILEHVIMTESLDSRRETAHVLRLLRAYQREVRRRAQDVAAHVYAETPKQFTRRMRRLWHQGERTLVPIAGGREWRRTA